MGTVEGCAEEGAMAPGQVHLRSEQHIAGGRWQPMQY